MSRSVLPSTVGRVIQGYNDWTVDSMLSPRSTDCIHEIHPASLHRLPMNNTQFSTYFNPFLSVIRDFQLTVHNTVVDTEAKTVAVYLYSKGETDLGPYANEYLLMLHMDEEGEKVERLVKFVDSAYSKEMFPKLKELIARQQKEQNFTQNGKPKEAGVS